MKKQKDLKHYLQKYRVHIARVMFLLLIAYVFGYERTAINSLLSPLGMMGVGVVLLGVVVRSVSAGVLHKNDMLATDGIYAIVRNPLYLGSLLGLIGMNVIIYDPLMALVSVLLIVITYVPTIRGEEKRLEKLYGDEWQAFKRSTPRILPNLLRLGALSQMNWRAGQWWKNHEHNTVLAVVAILALLQTYHLYWQL